MKKVMLALVAGVVVLASCKKDYECKKDGVVILECNSCTGSQKTAFDSTCSLAGGTVSVK